MEFYYRKFYKNSDIFNFSDIINIDFFLNKNNIEFAQSQNKKNLFYLKILILKYFYINYYFITLVICQKWNWEDLSIMHTEIFLHSCP